MQDYKGRYKMNQLAELSQKILENNMDYVVTWNSGENGVMTKVDLLDENENVIKTSVSEKFEDCLEEINVYFMQ